MSDVGGMTKKRRDIRNGHPKSPGDFGGVRYRIPICKLRWDTGMVLPYLSIGSIVSHFHEFPLLFCACFTAVYLQVSLNLDSTSCRDATTEACRLAGKPDLH